MISILVIALTIASVLMIYAVRLICRRDRQARNFARLTELTKPAPVINAPISAELEEWRTGRWD